MKKDIKVLLKKHDGRIREISQLITKLNYNDRLNDGCSKVGFAYINEELAIEVGEEIRIDYDGKPIFDGRIFSVGDDRTKIVTITAYDQLRYAKEKDYFATKAGETIDSLLRRMCNKFNFLTGHIAKTGYLLQANVYETTWLDILYEAIRDTIVNTGKWYALRDEAGYITLRDINDLKLDLILGDKSLCYDFSHETSIDQNFYNRILIQAVDGSIHTFVSKNNEKSMEKYGFLQYYEKLQNTNKSQAKVHADILAEIYSKPRETMTLECLGDIRVRAGVSVLVSIGKIGMNKQLIVKSVTHDFLPTHTMSVEVFVA